MALISPCNCGNRPSIVVDPGPSCEDCLKVRTVRVGCDSDLAPGGGEEGTLVVDLDVNNDVTACGEAGGVYSIYSFDADFWDSVVVTEEGVLTAVTSEEFTALEFSEIIYKFTCNEGGLSAYGSVLACKADLCFGVSCDEDELCNPSTGECDPII